MLLIVLISAAAATLVAAIVASLAEPGGLSGPVLPDPWANRAVTDGSTR